MNNLLKPSFYTSKIKTMLNLMNDHSGSYDSWSEALNNSKSYQDKKTIEQIQNVALVAKIENKYFRDGIVFENYQYSTELNNLIHITYAKKNFSLGEDKQLNILDFGGGAGSQQVQFQQHLNNFKINCNYKWDVVDQDVIVDFGKKELESKYLKFRKIKDLDFKKQNYDIVVLGAVLSFLENPFEILNKIIENNPPYIYIDRTSFWDGDKDVLCILKGNKHIPGSYPNWIFSLKNFINYFKNSYILKMEFNSVGGSFFFSKIRNGVYKGMIWGRE